MRPRALRYVVDPADPRAPPQEIWDRLGPAERARVVASLPSEFPTSEANPPEGDPHFNAKVGVKSALGGFFARLGRRVYLACELPIYYPGERLFAPDVIAVLDVETRERDGWVVSDEGKGLDFALEVHVAGDRKKDLERNVEWYARLGIPEYFIFDRGRLRLSGYRLPSPGAKAYKPIVPQHGRFPSAMLGLELCVEGQRLRFFSGTAELPEVEEMVGRLEAMVDGIEARARAAEERADEEAKLRKKETRLRKKAEKKLAEETQKLSVALAEIQRLKRSRK